MIIRSLFTFSVRCDTPNAKRKQDGLFGPVAGAFALATFLVSLCFGQTAAPFPLGTIKPADLERERDAAGTPPSLAASYHAFSRVGDQYGQDVLRFVEHLLSTKFEDQALPRLDRLRAAEKF